MALFPLIVPDQKADGGAICCWIDQREDHYEIYAKGINGSDGSTASGWNSNGNEVSRPPSQYTPHGHRLSHTATYGNEGEIIVAWVNFHSLENGAYKPGIYCQKFKNGVPQWPDPLDPQEGGIKITTASKNPPTIAPCDGGCVISWLDTSGDTTYWVGPNPKDSVTKTLYRIYAERLNVNGDTTYPGWGPRIIRSRIEKAHSPKLVPTPDNGVWMESISKTILTSRDNLLSLNKEEL